MREAHGRSHKAGGDLSGVCVCVHIDVCMYLFMYLYYIYMYVYVLLEELSLN
jgi:hypothetical protein